MTYTKWHDFWSDHCDTWSYYCDTWLLVTLLLKTTVHFSCVSKGMHVMQREVLCLKWLSSNALCCFASFFPDLRREGSLSPVNSQKITLLLQSPAVKFITNPEFFTVLHTNYVSAPKLQSEPGLASMKTKKHNFANLFDTWKKVAF